MMESAVGAIGVVPRVRPWEVPNPGAIAPGRRLVHAEGVGEICGEALGTAAQVKRAPASSLWSAWTAAPTTAGFSAQ